MKRKTTLILIACMALTAQYRYNDNMSYYFYDGEKPLFSVDRYNNSVETSGYCEESGRLYFYGAMFDFEDNEQFPTGYTTYNAKVVILNTSQKESTITLNLEDPFFAKDDSNTALNETMEELSQVLGKKAGETFTINDQEYTIVSF